MNCWMASVWNTIGRTPFTTYKIKGIIRLTLWFPRSLRILPEDFQWTRVCSRDIVGLVDEVVGAPISWFVGEEENFLIVSVWIQISHFNNSFFLQQNAFVCLSYIYHCNNMTSFGLLRPIACKITCWLWCSSRRTCVWIYVFVSEPPKY